MRLYEISAQMRNILDRIDDEVPLDLEAELHRLEGTLADKARNYVAAWCELECEAEAMQAESDRLHSLSKSRRTTAAKLKTTLLFHLDALGIDRVDTDLGKIRPQRASRPSIRWDGAGPVPSEFARFKVELDGTKAQEALKAGSLPEGFSVEYSRFIRVS